MRRGILIAVAAAVVLAVVGVIVSTAPTPRSVRASSGEAVESTVSTERSVEAPESTDSARPAESMEAAEPRSEAVPTERVADLVAEIGAHEGVRTVGVWYRDELVAERSFRGAGTGPHDIKSASKSVVSALVGIALEQGEIESLDETVAELLPELADGLPDAKRRISLGQILAMESGLASTSGEHYGAWVSTDDWTRSALARPLASEPGEQFIYSTGNSHLVAAILSRAVGEDLLGYGRRVLFEPLGMTVHGWASAPEGTRFGGNSFRITPADLGRFGRLYARGGEWEGRQLVPSDWVERSTERHAAGWPDRYGAYGLLWWLPDGIEGTFSAVGYGGQFCYVVPDRDIVIVVTSTIVGKGAQWDREVLDLFARIAHRLG